MNEPSETSDTGDTRSVNTRWFELFAAGLLMGLAALAIVDSLRVGTGWADDGPQSGYFPFRVGLLLLASSAWVFISQLRHWKREESFAERGQLMLVVSVFVPMVVYVAAIFVLGIYLASALLIAYFMLRYGKYKLAITLPVSLGVPLFFFLVFERWFVVPLPKGPIERMLGF